MTLVTLALSGQVVFYVIRERRRMWSSRPSLLVIVSSFLDLSIIGTLALGGILMAPLAPSLVAGICAGAVVLALVMDQVKAWLFAHFKMIQGRARLMLSKHQKVPAIMQSMRR